MESVHNALFVMLGLVVAAPVLFACGSDDESSPGSGGSSGPPPEIEPAATPDAIETRLESSPYTVFNPRNSLTFPRIDCSAPVRIDMEKQLVPTDDPGLFDLKVIDPVDGVTTVVANATHGSSDTHYGPPGDYRFGETAAAGTTLTDYNTWLFCELQGPDGDNEELWNNSYTISPEPVIQVAR